MSSSFKLFAARVRHIFAGLRAVALEHLTAWLHRMLHEAIDAEYSAKDAECGAYRARWCIAEKMAMDEVIEAERVRDLLMAAANEQSRLVNKMRDNIGQRVIEIA